ncbi:Oidioi.mRNA.OKI2018_I69.XSR.g15351.t1.cds [Oikopleura dioica]|uniref:Oidioi.mRNA.OKI2018_I69.XSR.g15351.t1.cds n=1 Tax=Oikopleura dioica TaxID=34765 RepID=A0ABN7SK14_OIKDI|nr:Oidioi.mRNA.OKI2018_I69.XSR.g15351.t1.cds [Oikopleura dioica]
MQHGPSHRAVEYAKAMAPDPFPQDRLDFQKRGFLDKQYEELEPLRCEDKRHNGYCNCVHRFIISSGDVPSADNFYMGQRDNCQQSAIERFRRIISIHNEAHNLKNTRNPVAGRKYSEAFSEFVTVHKKELTQNKLCKKAITKVLHCSLNFLYRDQNNNKRRVPRIEELHGKRCCDKECLSRVIRENETLIRGLLQEMENNQANETKRKVFYQLRRNSLCLKAIGEITGQSKATLNSLNSKEPTDAITHKLKDIRKTSNRTQTIVVKPEPGVPEAPLYPSVAQAPADPIVRAPTTSNCLKAPFIPTALSPTVQNNLQRKSVITQITTGSSSDDEDIRASVPTAAPRDRLEGISDSREVPPITFPPHFYPPHFYGSPNIISPSICPEISPGIRSPSLKTALCPGKRKKQMPGLAPIDGKESPSYKGKSSLLEYSALRKPTEDPLWLKIDTGISPLKKPLPVNPIENSEENSRKIRGEFEETRTPKTIDINTPSFKPKAENNTPSIFNYPDTH